MNKKYFLHFLWIITVFMSVFAVLLLSEGTSVLLALFMYVVAIVIYVLPMAYLKSKEAEIINMKIRYTQDNERKVEKTIVDKTKRVLVEDADVKSYQMKNRYYRWLTNEITVSHDEEMISISLPKAYRKLFVDLA